MELNGILITEDDSDGATATLTEAPAIVPRRPDSLRLLNVSIRFAVVMAVLWFAFELLYLKLPYTRMGSVVIATAKRDALGKMPLFESNATRRVLFVGDSRTLAGVKPVQFDSAMGPHFSSFNVGLPNEPRFMPMLDAALANGQVPTDVVTPLPWSPPDLKVTPIPDDGQIVGALFPFRILPRNLTLFALRAHSRGGFRAFYRQCEQSVTQMFEDRGYYFIEGQSHFPGNRLPPDFHAEFDTPASPMPRMGDVRWPEFEHLRQLARTYHMRVWFVPLYHREGECATAPAENKAWSAMLADVPEFRTVGPDYWIFPVADFSDPVHVNSVGADAYTRKLVELLQPLMTEAH